jgi:hypothetical protein
MTNETDDFDEEQSFSEAINARFAFAIGRGSENLGSQRVKRSLAQERKQALVQGPEDSSPMPIPPGLVAKYRTPRAFMDEALKYLHPEEIGPAFAKLFLSALEKQDIGLLKVLLPYVFGAPAKAEDTSAASGAIFGELLSVLKEPPIKNPTGKRGTTGNKKQESHAVTIDSFVLPEENPNDEQY